MVNTDYNQSDSYFHLLDDEEFLGRLESIKTLESGKIYHTNTFNPFIVLDDEEFLGRLENQYVNI